MCQDLTVSQREGSQLIPGCRLISSWTPRQQLWKDRFKPLSRRNWEAGTFACSLCAESSGRGVVTAWRSLLRLFKNCFYVCCSLVALWMQVPLTIRAKSLGPVPLVEALKVGALHVWSKVFATQGEPILVKWNWGFHPNSVVLCRGRGLWWECVSAFPFHFDVSTFSWSDVQVSLS